MSLVLNGTQPNKFCLEFPHPMKPEPAIQSLTLSLTASNLHPTLLSLNFLTASGILPLDWELAERPTETPQSTHIAFTNGISFDSQLGQIAFSESLDGKPLEAVRIHELIRQYVNALPNLDYRQMTIEAMSFFTFEESSDSAARHYIPSNLLAPGAWQHLGRAPVRATLNLAYILERSQFTLKIDDVLLRRADDTPEAAVLFSGRFPYEVSGSNPEEKLQCLHQIASWWREDLETYRAIVFDKFLAVGSEKNSQSRNPASPFDSRHRTA
jgi:hypothetical protein